MVQLAILAHELSPLEGKPDQYRGFPTGVTNMGRGGSSKFDQAKGFSQYMQWTWWGFQEKGKYLVNICTVVCKVKNVIFLLN